MPQKAPIFRHQGHASGNVALRTGCSQAGATGVHSPLGSVRSHKLIHTPGPLAGPAALSKGALPRDSSRLSVRVSSHLRMGVYMCPTTSGASLPLSAQVWSL